MNIEIDDDLLEQDDELEVDTNATPRQPPTHLDARRMIERRLELRHLREQLEDPEFNFSLD